MSDGIYREPETLFALWRGHCISRGQFFRHVQETATRLPDAPHYLNLCEDRYSFCVVLVAAATRGLPILLPPNGTAGILSEMASAFPGACAVIDDDIDFPGRRWQIDLAPDVDGIAHLPAIDPDQTAAVAFTSGSTGRPRGHAKPWRTFAASAAMALERFDLHRQKLCVVSTTPPQHMFGLETSIFWPLLSPLVMQSGRPFYPEDIRQTVNGAPLPCLLVSTPTHLRACAAASGPWRNIELALSSTAPLSPRLAEAVESRLAVPLYEIFGSTETLSFASRRPTQDPLWNPYDGAVVKLEASGFCLHARHLPQPEPLEDLLELREGGRFLIKGRMGDIVKVGGKRCSLAELDHHLNAIDGVADGCFFTIAPGDGLPLRVGALAVTDLPRREVLHALKQKVDEVFLPRPLHIVDNIPRNDVGKVLRRDLERLLEELRLERAF